jgi:hypothetical protein
MTRASAPATFCAVSAGRSPTPTTRLSRSCCWATAARADMAAIDRTGALTLIEVKSGRADFRSDRKWHQYLAYCDRFYLAGGRDFPLGLLPLDEGVILADRFGAEIMREARLRALSAARRKAMLIRFGRAAASRLRTLVDPRL